MYGLQPQPYQQNWGFCGWAAVWDATWWDTDVTAAGWAVLADATPVAPTPIAATVTAVVTTRLRLFLMFMFPPIPKIPMLSWATGGVMACRRSGGG